MPLYGTAWPLKLTACGGLVVLLTLGIFSPAVLAKGFEFKPIWAKALERDIVAACAEEVQPSRDGEESDHSLRWVLFRQGLLGICNDRGELGLWPEDQIARAKYMSANGRYLCTIQYEQHDLRERGTIRYSAIDWRGNHLWGLSDKAAHVLVWNDGSAVLVRLMPDTGHLLGLRFVDAQGSQMRAEEFANLPLLNRPDLADISNNYFAFAAANPEEGYRIQVYRKDGTLLWRREVVNKFYPYGANPAVSYILEAIGVVDSGGLLALFSGLPEAGSMVVCYDRTGSQTDSILIGASGGPVRMSTYRNLGLLCTEHCVLRGQTTGSQLLCYDFDSGKLRFLLEADAPQWFGHFDLNSRTDLVAVAVHSRDARSSLRLYDLTGSLQARFDLEKGALDPASKLNFLNRGLLVPEGKTLRLYSIAGGE